MGSCVSIELKLCDVCLNVEEIGNTCYSRSNIESLKEKIEELRRLKEGVEAEIQRKRNSQEEVSTGMETWVENAGKLERKVSRIIALHQYLCCEFCIRCKIGRVEEMIKQKPKWLPDNVVGMEQVMSQVLQYLNDDNVGVIGIHGMGGAGKTTLAKQLIKILPSWLSSLPSTSTAARAQESVKFENIIFVTVSQNLDVGKLQKDIAVELGIHERSEFKDESTRARFISSYLCRKRFLLVLDDVWKQFDLTSIGIPELSDCFGSKIVLTTREAKVGTDMGARKSMVKVGCLGEEDSWELFKKTIQWDDDEFNQKHIYDIARDIARKCGGLPLALITIARAMASKSDISLWRSAYELLKDSPHRIRGMEDVYRLLEFSYNNLKNEEYKSCLLYCSLFPEDKEIEINRIVDYCIGGGSVSVDGNMSGDIVRLRNQGRYIITELIDACSLERGRDEEHVKVHDAIRDMILFWLGRDNGENRIFSHAGKGITGTHVIDVKEWRAASMLSFYRNPGLKELVIEGKFKASYGRTHEEFVTKVEKIPWQSNHLQVLLLNSDVSLVGIPYKLPRRLFEYCPNLRVLDLSNTELRIIPASICSLTLLRYLNLSDTEIKTLPQEMRKLSSLIQLDLSDTEVDKIPNGLFSSLSKLQSLNIFYCPFFTSGENRVHVLGEIVNLRLPDICLEIDRRGYDVMKFHESDSLCNSITKLGIVEVGLSEHDLFKWVGSRFKRLEKLEINRCKYGDVKGIVIDDGHFSELKELQFSNMNCCRIIPEERWKLPNLKVLCISFCDGIVELMGPSQSEGDGIIHDQSLLPKLKYISIYSCPNILRISSSPLQLNSLKILQIGNCPSLKDISMIDSPHDLKIWCYSEWWKDLRWENSGGVPPSNFNPIFRRE